MIDKRNAMRGVLAGVYALLIALLMLSNCHGCDNEQPTEIAQETDTVTGDDGERARVIGHDGQIKVTALWDFPGDVDLHLTEPDGTEIWFRNMKHRATGAELDVDDIPGGPGSAENIYLTHPLEGQYVVELVMYNLNDDAPHGGMVRVVIEIDGVQERLPIRLSRQSQRVVVKRFNYPPRDVSAPSGH